MCYKPKTCDILRRFERASLRLEEHFFLFDFIYILVRFGRVPLRQGTFFILNLYIPARFGRVPLRQGIFHTSYHVKLRDLGGPRYVSKMCLVSTHHTLSDYPKIDSAAKNYTSNRFS